MGVFTQKTVFIRIDVRKVKIPPNLPYLFVGCRYLKVVNELFILFK